MRNPRRSMLAAIVVLSIGTFACVTAQDASRSQPKAQPQAVPPTTASGDSGFTVGETAVPNAPVASPTSSDGGFTVDQTAVPDK